VIKSIVRKLFCCEPFAGWAPAKGSLEGPKSALRATCHLACCLQVHLEGGKLQIDQEGRSHKFTKKVQQKTFAASSANGRAIMYVTERAVFKLVEGKGLELVEVAPGICSLQYTA